jgi:hypothetical protein
MPGINAGDEIVVSLAIQQPVLLEPFAQHPTAASIFLYASANALRTA